MAELIETKCESAAPPATSSFNVSTVDRFGNVLPTIIVNADKTLNWKSYDYADFFLSQLTAAPSLAIQNYINYIVDNYITAGIWDKMLLIRPYTGGNGADNGLNLRYPFKTRDAFYGDFVGTPIHDANGITFDGVTSYERAWLPSVLLPNANLHMSIYCRTNNVPSGVAMVDIAFDQSRRNMEILSNATRAISRLDGYFANPTPTWSSDGLFTFTARPGAGNAKLFKNDNLLHSGTALESALISRGYLTIGAVIADADNQITGSYISNRNYAMATVGLGLTDQEVFDKFNIDQAAQTILGRQV